IVALVVPSIGLMPWYKLALLPLLTVGVYHRLNMRHRAQIPDLRTLKVDVPEPFELAQSADVPDACLRQQQMLKLAKGPQGADVGYLGLLQIEIAQARQRC